MGRAVLSRKVAVLNANFMETNVISIQIVLSYAQRHTDKFPFPFSFRSFLSAGLDKGQGERKQQTSTEHTVNTKTVFSYSTAAFKQTETAS